MKAIEELSEVWEEDGADPSLPQRPPVSYDVQAGEWTLEAEYRKRITGAVGKRFTIVIPKGFRFDLASIPRVLWSVIASHELSITAPLVHDFLYRCAGRPTSLDVRPWRTFTRAEVDRLFYELMLADGVNRAKAWVAYRAVRACGWLPWRRSGRQ